MDIEQRLTKLEMQLNQLEYLYFQTRTDILNHINKDFEALKKIVFEHIDTTDKTTHKIQNATNKKQA